MRLYDTRQGQVTDVAPARRRLLRLQATGTGAGLSDLRAFLVADLIRRTAEYHRLVVEAARAPGPGLAGDRDAPDRDAETLGLRPPETRGTLDGPADIQVGGPDPGHQFRIWITPGPVRWDDSGPGVSAGGKGSATAGAGTGGTGGAAGEAGAGGGGPVAAMQDRGLDPLALRLAFMQQPYRDELTLSWPALAAADQALRVTRREVADWAAQPSRPLSASHEAEVTAAFDADLFTPGALAALRALATTEQVAPGAKFETLAHLDQLLGLDVARDIGR